MNEPVLVTYKQQDSIATITMDDGKANVMSQAMSRGLSDAFDRAEREASVVVLTGRERMFSGGYDLAMFQRSPQEIVATLRAGGELVERILSFPKPVIAACNGHAVAQGAFLLLAADVRIGARGTFKLGLNEVAIGLTIPHYGVEVARLRLTAPGFNHATLTGTLYPPEQALSVGLLDHLADPAELLATAQAEAERLTALDMNAHAGTKLRVRADALARIRKGIDDEFAISDQQPGDRV